MSVVVRALKRMVRRLGQELDEIKFRTLVTDHRIKGGYERIYLIHVRKCGGTSLNHMFLSLGGEAGGDVYSRLSAAPHYRVQSGNKIFAAWNKTAIERGNYFYAFSHIPLHQLRLPDRTFMFTCLREPTQRVLSHYKMLLEHRFAGVAPEWFEDESRWLGDGFDDFLSNLPRKNLLTQLHMFSKDFDPDEAFEAIMNCSHHFLLEDFSDGVRQLSTMLDLPLRPRHVRRSSRQPAISPDSVDRLRELLEPEYNLYQRLMAQRRE